METHTWVTQESHTNTKMEAIIYTQRICREKKERKERKEKKAGRNEGKREKKGLGKNIMGKVFQRWS